MKIFYCVAILVAGAPQSCGEMPPNVDERIRGAFRWFYAEKLRNFDFYENLQFQKTFGPL